MPPCWLTDGTPAPDSDYDYGASLRQQRQESFGGQSIGTTQPGALMIGVAGGVAVGTGNDAGASAALGRIASGMKRCWRAAPSTPATCRWMPPMPR